ncbi:hypothetical protein AABB24_028101 [Solanum stoloniferum]|uniref:Uncharacterized protein n=1 Tax=Solanum stoloniferum TaxID=62892 RepID=A0ABD2S7J4_9SOLN
MNFNCEGKFPLKACIKILERLSRTSEVLMTSLVYCSLNNSFCSHANAQLLWLTVQVIEFLLLNMHLHVCQCLHSIINSDTILEQSISSLISKNTSFFEILESFLTTKSPEAVRANQLACRFVLFFSEQWWLFRKAAFASTELEALGYSPDESILGKS